ncbi:hypothetical protein C8R45DRAFT_1015424 [Mycena sanguinolenta]|nr:hypothetical protein C8R45DRAFT_1015424 [Mycena sanguinolenta]
MNHTDEDPTSSEGSEPKLESEREVKLVSLGAKLAIFHAAHAVLVGAHAVAVVAAVKVWFMPVEITKAAAIQTGVTALLQGAFLIIVGGLISLVREFAVDETIQHPPTLGVLHLRLNAWSGLFSALSANWLYFQSTSDFTPPGPLRLKTVMFYLGCGTLLQVSSGAIIALGVNLNASPIILSFPGQPVDLASRFGNFDEIWSETLGLNSITSSNPNQLPPAARNAVNAALNMFPVRPNHTRYPGLQGRLLHDLVNQNNLEVPFGTENTWSAARVQATLVNIHCSQIEDATVNTFTLPLGSTDLHLAQPSPRDGSESFIFGNISDLATSGAWVNVSMPKPPYWDPDLPGLNIMGYWGSYSSTSYILPTKVYFQPWAWAPDTILLNGPPGHNQVVIVIATQRPTAFIVDSAGDPGPMVNLTQHQETNPSDGGHGGQAYIQVIGCTATNEDLTATIDPEGRLLDPPTLPDTMVGFEGPHDDHTWDEFQWGDTEGGSQAERQFLLALTPSSTYNDTGSQGTSMPTRESLLADLLDGSAPSFSFIGTTIQRNALVTFQGALERLYASYLWNVNTLCTPPSAASIKWPVVQPSLQGCPSYYIFGSEADLEVVIPAGAALTVVKWRAIASLVSCALMWLIGSSFISMRRRRIQHADGLLDSARILGQGSKIPQVVAEETMALKLGSTKNPRRALFNSVLTRRLKYVEDDGIDGYLDIDDSTADSIPSQN